LSNDDTMVPTSTIKLKGNKMSTIKLIKQLEEDRAKAIVKFSKSVYVKDQEPFQKEILGLDMALRHLKGEIK